MTHPNKYVEYLLNKPIDTFETTPEDLATLVSQDLMDKATIACDPSKWTTPQTGKEVWENVLASIKAMRKDTQ